MPKQTHTELAQSVLTKFYSIENQVDIAQQAEALRSKAKFQVIEGKDSPAPAPQQLRKDGKGAVFA